jgi:hypothetical protein
MASYTEPIQASSIPKKQLTFYTNSNGSSSSSSNGSGSTSTFTFTAQAGEDIAAGEGVFINTDNKAYRATSLAADNKTASCVALTSAVEDATIILSNAGTVIVQTADFTQNELIYVRSSSDINFSQELLETATVAEDTVQALGRAVSATAYVIEVSEPLILE